jgi:hypothetical protein
MASTAIPGAVSGIPDVQALNGDDPNFVNYLGHLLMLSNTALMAPSLSQPPTPSLEPELANVSSFVVKTLTQQQKESEDNVINLRSQPGNVEEQLVNLAELKFSTNGTNLENGFIPSSTASQAYYSRGNSVVSKAGQRVVFYLGNPPEAHVLEHGGRETHAKDESAAAALKTLYAYALGHATPSCCACDQDGAHLPGFTKDLAGKSVPSSPAHFVG